MADQLRFYVDIEDTSGSKLGGGPLTSVARWRYTARLDRAGSIDFVFSAGDPQADQATTTRIAKAYALLNGAWAEVGAGIIDDRTIAPEHTRHAAIQATGRDLIGELSFRSVGNLEIGEGSGATLSSALTSIGNVASGQGWTLQSSGTVDNDYIYARYGGESVLGALIYLADRTQTHLVRTDTRTLTFSSDFTDSGIRAIQMDGDGDLQPETCAILSLQQTVDSHDLLTRIIPYGSGQGQARLTLAATSRSAPSGYTLDAANNYIQDDSAHSAYGLRDHPEVEFKEITPISNTDADLQAAANMLFDAALEELKRRASLTDQRTYSLRIGGCSELLRPQQTIRVVYRDEEQGIDIDEDLFILEATWEVDETGVGTTDLVVSTQDRWPQTDSSVAADRAAEGRVFQAHPQMNANSYTLGYTKRVDADNEAAFRFRMGNEIVNLQQVLFEFQLLPFEATVRSVGVTSVTGGSGELVTDGPSSNTSGNPSNDTSGSPSTNASGNPSTNTSGSPSTNTSSGPSVTDTGAATGSTAGATGDTSAATGSTTGATGSTAGPSNNTSGSPSNNTSGSPSDNTSGGSGTLETDGPQGGEIDGAGQHYHDITLVDDSTGFSVTALHVGSGRFQLQAPHGMGTPGAFIRNITRGDHTHDVDGHTHDLASHTHDLSSHTHDLSSHTHSLNNHTHGMNNHTHGMNSHTHGMNNHTHGLNSHTHSLQNHTHDLGNHTHNLSSHTHDLGNHTHDLGNHTHNVTPDIDTQYGIFRDNSANVYDISDLEYRVNSGTWTALSGNATDAGDGWWQLDITNDVMDSTTFRPLQANNLLEIRGTTVTEDIEEIDGDATSTDIYVLAPTQAQAGQNVTISAATSSLNGDYTVDSIGSSGGGTYDVLVCSPGVSGAIVRDEGAGVEPLLTINYQATIDAQLAVRNVIQAISYST